MQRSQQRLAAFALSTVLTLLMLAATNELATSAPPAGLVAQMAVAAQRA